MEYKPGRGNVVADALSKKTELAAISSVRSEFEGAINDGMQCDTEAKKDYAVGCSRPNQTVLGRRRILAYHWPEDLCTKVLIHQVAYYQRKPRHFVGWASGTEENEGISGGLLFLAAYAGRNRAVCADFSCVPARQGGAKATRRAVGAITHS